MIKTCRALKITWLKSVSGVHERLTLRPSANVHRGHCPRADGFGHSWTEVVRECLLICEIKMK